MGRIKNLMGVVKDKISLSKATVVSNPTTLSLHLAVLRATSHSPSSPPSDHRLHTLLTLGDSSRATASLLIHSLINRLHRTTDSSVALKSLLTIHHIIKQGPFILQDQLSSLFSSTGGRNYLNLSSFRDPSSATTWVLSGYVRWYARYLETILSASRTLGFVLCSSSCSLERAKRDDSISSFLNSDLIRDVDSLVGVMEEICNVPDNLLVERNKLLYGVMELLGKDYLSTVNEFLLRLTEFKQRRSLLSFNDSVELARASKRLRNCKEKLLELFIIRKPSIETLWEMIEELNKELNNKIGTVNLRKMGYVDRATESARFGDRVGILNDSVAFSSGRFGLNDCSLMRLDEEYSTA